MECHRVHALEGRTRPPVARTGPSDSISESNHQSPRPTPTASLSPRVLHHWGTPTEVRDQHRIAARRHASRRSRRHTSVLFMSKEVRDEGAICARVPTLDEERENQPHELRCYVVERRWSATECVDTRCTITRGICSIASVSWTMTSRTRRAQCRASSSPAVPAELRRASVGS